ncbi:MAG: hypothetical protein PVH61_25835 [Candidatus Aminicenantes bacterium]|jgi:hypothetical protein
MKREAGPSGHLKNNHLKSFTIGISLAILFITAFFISCSIDTTKEEKSSAVPPYVESVKEKLVGLENEIQKKENEKLKLIARFEAKTGKKFPISEIFNIGEKEMKVLEEYIRNEKNVSIKDLLKDLVKKEDEIQALHEEHKTLNERHKPHVVKKGENHYQIAIEYLLFQRGLDKGEAKKLLNKAVFFDPLTPGFKVWNFFDGKEYSSFITQGEASISPAELERRKKEEIKKVIEEERLKAQERENELKKATQEFKAAQRKKQIELEAAKKRAREIQEQKRKMERQLNSLYYLVDTEKNLKDSGIIAGGFLRSKKLKAVNPMDFKNSIDLRVSKTININAALLDLKKIKKIRLFPKHYTDGVDFKIDIGEDQQEANVVILKEEKFKKQYLVISVR